MKNLLKKISVLLIAVFMLVGTGIDVHAVTQTDVNTDKATVTVEKVEAGTTLNLYKIVEPDIDATTQQMKGYKFTTTAAAKLVDPDEEITLTLSDGGNNYTITKKAKDLDADNDGIVDSTITLASESVVPDGAAVGTAADTLTNKEWTVGAGTGKVIYDMEAPTQSSISLAIANGALDSSATYTATAADGTDYVQQLVAPGQYIGLLTAPNTSNTSYNPVVLSAGYKGLQKYKPAETGQPGTRYYLKKDGTFTTDAPTAQTKHLYDVSAWNSSTNTANDPTWIADGTTTEDQLIAGNVDPAKDYSVPQQAIAASGTKALAKKSTPDMVKKATTDFKEEGKDVALVATDENGNPKYVTGNDATSAPNNPDSIRLVYVKAPFTGEQYNEVRNGTKFYKLENGAVVETTEGDTNKVTTAQMETLDAHLAQTTSEDAYSVSQGERIDYKLEPTIPQYPNNAKNKTLTFTDKMGNGISFVPGSIDISFGVSPEVIKSYDIDATVQYKFYVDTTKTFDENVNSDGKWFLDNGTWKQVDSTATTPVVPAAGTKLYDLVAEAKEQAKDGTLVDGNNFQINFNYDAIPGAEGNKVSPVIEYNAVLNENAICGIPGNVNVATMYYAKNSGQGSTWDQWTKPSGEDYKEDHDEGVVYTYEIKFRKTNDKEEFIEDENGTYVLLKSENNDWTAEQKARYATLLAGATAWYKANASADQYGKLIPEGYLIELTAANQAGDDVFYNATPKYKKNDDFEPLAGAVFGLYKAADCKDADLITKITTNAQGFGHTTDVHGDDTYYLKEIVAPTGYSLNTTVYPVTPTWTSATTWSTDTVSRYVYSVVEYQNWATDTKTHTGWLVAPTEDSETGKYYDMDGNDPSTSSNTEELGRYFGHGDGNGEDAWQYNYATKTMTKGNVVVKYVFPAVVDGSTSTTTKTDTVYNNNGGTLYLARVNNTKTSELPSTGGIGTYMFTIAGVAILATAAFMLIFRKKEENV